MPKFKSFKNKSETDNIVTNGKHTIFLLYSFGRSKCKHYLVCRAYLYPNFNFSIFFTLSLAVTVTVTEEFVVRPLQLVRWRITQSNCRV